MKLRFHNF